MLRTTVEQMEVARPSSIVALMFWVGLACSLHAQEPRLAPRMEIPPEGRGYLIDRVADGFRYPDGEVVVATWGEGQVLVFTSKGTLARVIGAPGSGPGEFQAPRGLGPTHRGLYVWDPALSRLTFFQRTGPTTGTRMVPLAGKAVPVGDSAILVIPQQRHRVALTRERLVVRRFRESTGIDTILDRPWHYTTLRYRLGETAVLGPQPFDDGEIIGVAPDGGTLVIVTRSVPSRSDGAFFRVEAFASDGREIYNRTFSYQPRRVTAQHRTNAVKLLESVPTRDSIARRRAIDANLVVPRFLPPVTSVLVGVDGSVWLRREEPAGDRAQWMILDERGDKITDVTAPTTLKGLSADRSHIFGVVYDRDWVPTLMVYELIR